MRLARTVTNGTANDTSAQVHPRKSIKRVKQRVNEVLAPGNVKPWAEVRDQRNAILRGWAAYFGYGTRAKAYKAIDHHVCGAFDTSSVGGIRFQTGGRGDFPMT